MLHGFAIVGLFIIVGILFIFGALFIGRFLRPNNPEKVKSEIYECGEVPVGPSWVNFNIRFYLFALIFVIFDVEAALMFPVVAVFKRWVAGGRGMLALVEIFIFVIILFIGLIYVWKKRDLEWVKTVDRLSLIDKR